MKILLTGATGGIGSAIKDLLIKNEIEVLCPTSSELDLRNDFKLDINKIDGLIHAAGVNYLAPYTEIDYNKTHELFNINTLSFIKLCSLLNFNINSNIIAIGSLYAECIKEKRIQYTMSKHALYGAVKTLAIEMSNKKIKVNMISPGFVYTQMTVMNLSTERIEFLKNNIPLGLVDAASIADLCLFMMQKNSFITGQNIIIDGGYTLSTI